MKKPNKNDVAPQGGDFRETSVFQWTEEKSQAAIALACGKTHIEAGEAGNVSDRTIRTWLQNVDFAAEVDRLTLMVDVSSRAERLRIAMRVVRQKTEGNQVKTDKDVLEWLKFAQSETDGVKLDLTKLSALSEDDAPLAGGRQAGIIQHEESAESVN